MKQTQLSYPALAKALVSSPPQTASFETTYNGLATAAARIHTLRDGELVLYKRSHNRVWQCRYKLYDNQCSKGAVSRETKLRVSVAALDSVLMRQRQQALFAT